MIEKETRTKAREEPKIRVSRLMLAVIGLTLVISIICIWFYPSINDFMASNKMWNGLNNFSREFGATGIDSLDELPELPAEYDLVAIPYLPYRDEELSKLKRFVNDGGTLLLMDDYGYGNQVLSYLNLEARFSNKPLLDPLFSYRNQWLPRITDFTETANASGIVVITLNHATALLNIKGTQAIAWSSKASFLDTDENGSQDPDEPGGPFPVAASFRLGKGTVTLASDPSIVITSMLNRDDNYRFLKYLASSNGQENRMIVDMSHLSKTPLDTSKTSLVNTREVLVSPAALVGITAVVFVIISGYVLRKEEIIGR